MLTFRSQKTSYFQKESGLHGALRVLSLDGLSAGQVLGFSADPWTTEKHKELADNHPNFAAEQITKGTNVIIILSRKQSLMVLFTKCIDIKVKNLKQ